MQIALAPMEGLVDNILRDVLTRVGGIDWCVTEFIRVCDRLLPPSSFDKLAPELRRLDLTVLHSCILEPILGIDETNADKRLTYVSDTARALDLIEQAADSLLAEVRGRL